MMRRRKMRMVLALIFVLGVSTFGFIFYLKQVDQDRLFDRYKVEITFRVKNHTRFPLQVHYELKNDFWDLLKDNSVDIPGAGIQNITTVKSRVGLHNSGLEAVQGLFEAIEIAVDNCPIASDLSDICYKKQWDKQIRATEHIYSLHIYTKDLQDFGVKAQAMR